jgi:hypothetical protein
MCWIKVAGAAALLAPIGAGLGVLIAGAFGLPVPGVVDASGPEGLLALLIAVSAPIQAVTTVFLAIFTSRLVRLTRGQLKAAEDNAAAARSSAEAAATQARAAEQTISSLERPHLFPICEHNFTNVLEPLLRHWRLYDHPGSGWPLSIESAPIVSFRFRNYGKSPAIVRQIAGSIVAGPTYPAPVAPHWVELPKENVLLPGDTSEPRSTGVLDPFTFEVGKNDFGALLASETYWWFYGFVVYEDVIDTEHTSYFCYRFDYGMRLFEPIPPDRNYTEHRKIERALPADRPVKGAFRVTPPIPEASPPPITNIPY